MIGCLVFMTTSILPVAGKPSECAPCEGSGLTFKICFYADCTIRKNHLWMVLLYFLIAPPLHVTKIIMSAIIRG